MRTNFYRIDSYETGNHYTKKHVSLSDSWNNAKSRLKRDFEANVLLSELPEISVKSADIAFTAKPTYRFCVTYRISIFAVHTANCFLNKKAGVKRICLSKKPPSRISPIKRKDIPQLQAATKQPLTFDGLILLYLRLKKLSTRVWFGVAPHFAVEILLEILFIDRFICENFLVERKVVPWHSEPLAVLVFKQTSQKTRTWSTVPSDPEQSADQNVECEVSYRFVKLGRQIVLLPCTQHHVLVTAKTQVLLTFKLRKTPKTCHSILVARVVMDILQKQPLYILLVLSVAVLNDRFDYWSAWPSPNAELFQTLYMLSTSNFKIFFQKRSSR